MGVLSILDPSAVFCAFCIIVPMYKDRTTTDEERVAFVTDPFFMLAFGLLFLSTIIVRLGKCVDLSSSDRVRARWYLWNGAIIHFMMDGGVGALRQLPLFLKQYMILDKRFRDPEAYTVPVLVGLVEFAIMTPLCLLTYYAYRRGCWWRYAVELVTCTCHLFGVIMFCMEEHMLQYPSIITDPTFSFTEETIIYFWFGYCVNLVWVVIPLYFMWTALMKMAPTDDKAAKKKRN